MRVLVTGVAGFIGSHLCDRLLRDGHDVHGVDDFSTGKRENLADCLTADGFRLAELDIVEPAFGEHVRQVAPEVVVHLAAQMDVRKSVADPLADARVNVLGTVRLLDAVRDAGTARVVFASSGGTVYGEPDALPVPEDAPLRPVSPYGAAKVAGETYVAAFAGLYGRAHCTLALGNVYGSRQDPHGEAGVVAIFARGLLGGSGTCIYGDGTAVRDYVHVSDVVQAVVLAVEGRGDGQRFNIGTGTGTSVRELHTLLAELTGAPDAPATCPARTGELDRIVLDVRAAAADLGWTPRTELRDGLRETLDWVKRTASA